MWIIDAQHKLAQEGKFPTWKDQFGLFLDDNGLWRCGGRLGNTALPYTTKHPVLLPRRHPVTSLIIWDTHKRVQHNGVKETLTEIRTKYWITKARSLVRSIISHFVVCRRFEGVLIVGHRLHHCQHFEYKSSHHSHTEEWTLLAPCTFVPPEHLQQTKRGSASSHAVWWVLFT